MKVIMKVQMKKSEKETGKLKFTGRAAGNAQATRTACPSLFFNKKAYRPQDSHYEEVNEALTRGQ